MKTKALVWIALFGTFLQPVVSFSQVKVREEDHFWRKRIVNRIPFGEKINSPLVYNESAYYDQHERYTHMKGMVAAMLDGLKSGAYVAYDPDDWKKTLTWQEVEARMREYDAAISAGESWDEPQWEAPANDEFGTAPATSPEDEWAPEAQQEQPTVWNQSPEEKEIDLGPYEQVIHVVEDRVFDKNRSMMTYVMDHFEIIWQDPTGALPEKVLVRLRFDDVRSQLEQTMWKNRFNDAEIRSVAEVMDLRLFRSYMISVGGEPVTTLMEAERRKQELIEFEHHLWVY